ncbi:MAG TPA: hotdog fold thioesterase [Balneolales bacterium]|nr:hotdog fold thioesterase [Balneolales bacterium]
MYIEKSLEDKVTFLFDKARKNMGDALGIQFEHIERDKLSASMPVNESTIQPFGLLHGGASVALAETLASVGAVLNIDQDKKTAVGLEINANHIRSVRHGKVIGTARPLHRGAQTHVWEIKIRTEDDKLVCVSRCTLAIIKKKMILG